MYKDLRGNLFKAGDLIKIEPDDAEDGEHLAIVLEDSYDNVERYENSCDIAIYFSSGLFGGISEYNADGTGAIAFSDDDSVYVIGKLKVIKKFDGCIQQ